MGKIDSKDNFIKFVQRYQNLVFSICLKLTGDYFAAEDLAQETFMSAYQHQSKFDGENEKAWLCRIATNKCVDYQRAAARRVIPMLEEEIPWDFTGEQNGPLQTVLNQEVLEELRTCCQALGPPYHEIARLHFLEGKTAKEISELLGENLHTVQTWIYRARQKLKKSLRKEWLKE